MKTPMPENRIPPYSQQAEQAILGAMLSSRSATETALALLTPDDFYLPTNAEVFSAIKELVADYKPADPLTVEQHLTAHNRLPGKAIGYELSNLLSLTPAVNAVERYAILVREKTARRLMLAQAYEQIEAAYTEETPLAELLPVAEEKLLSIRDRDAGAGEVLTIGQIAHSRLSEVQASLSRKQLPGFLTGWGALNRILRPVLPGQVVVVAARPGMGKTAFALNWSTYLGESGIPNLVFSLEMDGEELVSRALFGGANVTEEDLVDPDQEEGAANYYLQKLATSAENLDKLPVYITDKPGRTVSDIAAVVRRYKRKHGIRAVFLDYLQLSRSEGKHRSTDEAITAISQGLVSITKAERLPLIVLSQLNRECESRIPRRPQLSDLRGSGAIEQDAHRVILLYRPGYYGAEEVKKAGLPPDKLDWTEVILAKQRSGRVGKALLRFVPNRQRFVDLREDEWKQLKYNQN